MRGAAGGAATESVAETGPAPPEVAARPDPCEFGAVLGRLPPCPAGGDCAAFELWRRSFGPGGPIAVPGAGLDERGEPKRIDLSLRDADLVEVLRSFAEMFDLDLVIDPRVSGRVTVELHDVPWTDALGVVLRVNGLGIDVSLGVATVSPGGSPPSPAPGPLRGRVRPCPAAPAAGVDDDR
jgi:hypothetical protein